MRYSPMHNFSVEKKLQDFCDSQLPIYGLCITAKFIFICFQGVQFVRRRSSLFSVEQFDS
jgi:hypothetical protein